MSVTIQDILNLVEDYAGANTGQADNARKIRAVGNAYKYFQRKGLIPSNEGINSFWFSDDQFFYDCPTDFMEEIAILYNDPAYNTSEREWEFEEYSLLLKRAGAVRIGNKWSFTTINGTNQLVLLGQNIAGGTILEAFDEVGDWVISGDGSNLAQDLLQKKVGDGSLSFDISDSTHLVTLTSGTLSLDVKSLFEKHGYLKLWTFMTTVTAVTSWRIKLLVDGSNYWTITATEYDDGTAFSANSWKKMGFALDDAVETGTPEITDLVTQIKIEIVLDAAFTTAVDFRVDHLFTSIPDYLDFIYRSRKVGTDASAASINSFSTTTDILGVGALFPDIDDLIARRAALNLWPSLRNDKEWYMMYKDELKELIKDVGMRFPRKRTNKYLPTRLTR